VRFPASGAAWSLQGEPCTDYNDKRVPSKTDMEEIAWIIRTKDVNRQVGFTKDEESHDEKDDEVKIVPSE
jgi:hypothetical protein